MKLFIILALLGTSAYASISCSEVTSGFNQKQLSVTILEDAQHVILESSHTQSTRLGPRTYSTDSLYEMNKLAADEWKLTKIAGAHHWAPTLLLNVKKSRLPERICYGHICYNSEIEVTTEDSEKIVKCTSGHLGWNIL